jgi:hypothetical protein
VRRHGVVPPIELHTRLEIVSDGEASAPGAAAGADS